MKRTALKATRKPSLSPQERLQAAEWRSNMGSCQVCRYETQSCFGPIQPHHVIEAKTLKKRGLHEHLYDVRNRLPVCEWRHEQHTTRFKPIPRRLIPASAEEFAEELGLTYLLDRYYA